MQKLLRNNIGLIVVIIFSLLISWPIFITGYFTHHDDLQVMRVFEMRKCFEDFQIPCRWVPDMGYGYGFPLFNYYSALPYYIGGVFSYLFGFVGAAKVIFLIPLVLAGISMYLLSKQLFGAYGGIVSAILYIFAPYRALDIYVRGAVAESFAIAIAPLMFYFSQKYLEKLDKKNFIFFAITLGCFLVTHNIMTLMFLPLLLIWIVFLLYQRKFVGFKGIASSFLLGFGLASFFLLPAFLEKELVRVDTLTRYDLDFRVHFVTIKQLFLDRNWGYGASVLGPNDTISFQIGWPHWLLAIGAILFGIWSVFKKDYKKSWLVLIFGFVFLVSIFMTHNRSAFVWEKIGLLKFVQFPWRFLSLTIFCVSILSGVLFVGFKKKLIMGATILLIIVTAGLNFSYFKPEKIYPLTDNEKLSGVLWEEQRKAALFDYLPKGLIEPNEPAPEFPKVVLGDSNVNNFSKRSNSWSFEVDAKNNSTIEVPIFDFPNWKVKIDNLDVSHTKNSRSGVILVSVPQGRHQVMGIFSDTPIRSVGNTLSFMSILILILLSFYYGKVGKFFK